MRILIVESGFTRGALAASRALAQAGWTVGIGSPSARGLAASSRYSDRWHEVPPVEEDLDLFIEATERAVVEGGYEVVFCSEDAQALGLSFGRERLSAPVPYPPHPLVLRAFDKMELTSAARRAGLATPETALATDRAIAEFELPVIVKSRLHWTPGAQRAPARLEATIVSDRTEVRHRVSDIRRHGGEALLQSVVRGRPLHHMVIVDEQGEIIVRVQTLAEPLLYPGPDVGQRVRSITVPVDEELDRRIAALLKDLEWVGMTSLMLILPNDGGEPVLTDFNSRCVASSDQYIAAGINFPSIWACLATGCPLPPIGPVKVGVRFQWLEGDLRRAIRQRRGGLIRDVMDCLSYSRGAAHTLWRLDDPIPSLRFGARLVKEMLGKLRRWPITHAQTSRPPASDLSDDDRGSAAGAPHPPDPPSTTATTPTNTPTS